jgi:hypothetical protein
MTTHWPIPRSRTFLFPPMCCRDRARPFLPIGSDHCRWNATVPPPFTAHRRLAPTVSPRPCLLVRRVHHDSWMLASSIQEHLIHLQTAGEHVIVHGKHKTIMPSCLWLWAGPAGQGPFSLFGLQVEPGVRSLDQGLGSQSAQQPGSLF